MISSCLKRCSTKSFVSLLCNRIALLFAIIFPMKGEFLYFSIIQILYFNLQDPTRLPYVYHVLPVCDVRDPQRVLMLFISLYDSCTSERSIESVSYEAFSALESISTRSDFWHSNGHEGTRQPCLFPQSSLTMF